MSDITIYFLIGASVTIAFTDLVAIMNLLRSNKNATTKLAWTLLIILLPLFGLIAWGIYGPRGMPRPPTSPEHSK